MPNPTYALTVTAAYFDEVVEQRSVRAGTPLQLGNSPVLGIPVPEGFPYVAKVVWTSSDTATVVDGRGRAYVLDPDNAVEVELGPVKLGLSLAPQFALKRIQGVSWRGSVAWLAIVVMVSVVVPQAELLWDQRCAWFGICPPADSAGGAHGIEVTAEYLARLLREDYAGADEGVITDRVERPEAEKEENRFFLPAGSEGPVTKMGGAAETSPEPIRTPPEEEEPLPAIRKEQQAPLYAEDVGTPIHQPINEVDEVQDGVAMAADDSEGEPKEAIDPPSEEEEGWGIPDWYDEHDAQFENLQIELMLLSARQRLAIDPDDQEALSILSYYQYLAQDYDAARRTYERYIELFPDEPAGYNNMALVYKRLGDYDREEYLYRVALGLEPDDYTAMNNLAVNLGHQGRYEEALAVMEQLAEEQPDDAYAHLHRAKIHAEMGNDELAMEFLERALQGMARLDTLHHIEFRQDIRIDPSFAKLRQTYAFRAILDRYYGQDSPLQE